MNASGSAGRSSRSNFARQRTGIRRRPAASGEGPAGPDPRALPGLLPGRGGVTRNVLVVDIPGGGQPGLRSGRRALVALPTRDEIEYMSTSDESRLPARTVRARERARRQVQARLEPGEQVQAVFPCQTGPRGILSLGLAANLVRYWQVAVTDRNLVIMPMQAKGLSRLPREPFEMPETPVRRGWFQIKIGSRTYDVAAQGFDLVAAANALLRAGKGEPPVTAAPEPSATHSHQAPAGASASWYPDPTHGHQLRYWDGSTWTAYVADQGAQSIDPVKAS